MRLTVLALLLVLLTVGCHRKPPRAVIPSLPVVKTEDVPAPEKATVVIQSGSNLREVAASAYGHEDFSGFVAQLNGISDPRRVAAGAVLKTPSLAAGLREAGLDPDYQPAINVLAKNWSDLKTVLPDFERECDASGVHDGSSFTVTPAVKDRLTKCADAVDAAIDVLRHPKQGHVLPRSAIGQFAGVSTTLRHFAAGKVESLDYDVFLAEKAYGMGFTYVLIWAQSGHQ
jgi:hypothetical protein